METGLGTWSTGMAEGFLPYLWGMETQLPLFLYQRTCWVLTVPMRNGNSPWNLRIYNLSSVLTVPMRNGNSYRRPLSAKQKFVLTVPMRNGNFPLKGKTVGRCVRSYRTYEEWKRQKYRSNFAIECPFLPYLWGMETSFRYRLLKSKISSYRTYEEWKQLWNLR